MTRRQPQYTAKRAGFSRKRKAPGSLFLASAKKLPQRRIDKKISAAKNFRDAKKASADAEAFDIALIICPREYSLYTC